ncbi:MAG: flagellar biosynthesis protein FlhB [Planctomycetota bacterium]
MPDDMGEKTEDATPKKLSKARQEGKVSKSQDLTAAISLLLAVILMYLYMGPIFTEGVAHFTRVFGTFGEGIDESTNLAAGLVRLGTEAAKLIVPLLIIAVIVAYVAQFNQVGWLWTLKPIQPKISKLNPVAGAKKFLGVKNLVKTGMNSIKLAALLTGAAIAIAARLRTLSMLPQAEGHLAFVILARVAFEIALILAILLILIGLIDFVYQKWQHKKDLKMTKQEVKDERRQVEPDPEVRKQQFKMYQGLVMQQVASGTPAADVVVTNPTHFSVAIKYDSEKMRAPRVTAKGADYLAFRMREIARVNGVPIVERPPLARALYAGVEVGEEISAEHYEAVAELLAYVYGLDGEASRAARDAIGAGAGAREGAAA